LRGVPEDPREEDLRGRVAALTLEEKVSLLTGADFWTTPPLPGAGLRKLVTSDGPAGVRGRWEAAPLREFTSREGAILGGRFAGRCAWSSSPLKSVSATKHGRHFTKIGRFEPTSQVFGVRGEGRAQAPPRAGVDLPGLRRRP